MGAHQAALPFKTLPAGDRLCGMTSHSSAGLLSGDSVRMMGERKRVPMGRTPIRSEATPARGEDEESKHQFFRQPAAGTWSTPSAPKLNPALPLVNRSIARWTATKTEASGTDETTNENPADGSELAREAMYCDILPRSLACRFLHLAATICEEVDSEFKLRKSKKPQRLSTTSWDLLD